VRVASQLLAACAIAIAIATERHYIATYIHTWAIGAVVAYA
jgi:uncharacterized membrane protein YgaE (UPF0421/DUF939 family)